AATTRVTGGIYYMRVRGISKKETIGAWSDHQVLVVRPPAPSGLVPDNLTVKAARANEGVPLRWDAVPGAGRSYVVRAYKAGETSAMVERRVTGNATEIPALPSGRYLWTVAAILEKKDFAGRSLASTLGEEWEGVVAPSRSFELIATFPETFSRNPQLEAP